MTLPATGSPVAGAPRALWTSTLAFTICFAVWTLHAIVGIRIRDELALTDTQFGLLIGTPILIGSVLRVPMGVLADRYGGRRTFAAAMVLASVATFLAPLADTYAGHLVAAMGIGLAGSVFPAGAAYVATFYTEDRESTAADLFGLGNVGATLTAILAPFVLVAAGWGALARGWAAALLLAAVLLLSVTCGSRDARVRRRQAASATRIRKDFAVLQNPQVWRFALYYFFFFGGFVALALWLPQYLMRVYGLELRAAGALSAFYSLPAAVFGFYGGRLSERYGVRSVMYWAFGLSVFCAFLLSYPPTTYTIEGLRGPITFSTSMGLVPFLVTLSVLGFFMGLGKGAVFRLIPIYYPDHVGAVGGLVGAIGGLGGFFLPLAFGALNDLTGVWTSGFALLFVLVTTALVWMTVAIRQMERVAAGRGVTAPLPELPELEGFGEPEIVTPPRRAGVIADWRPEDETFWRTTGRAVARRNLWISTYCLLISFAVWMLWSVIVATLPGLGFKFSTDELFWLAAAPGLSGATLRIFYAFLVPIFGGRAWTTISTASLLVPAFGIAYAVSNPDTPYLVLLALALLSGLGGGNFASSMANISYFFPKAEKGHALAINAGLGNLGVSIMQFVVPLAIGLNLFGVLGGPAQVMTDGTRVWMQNAGLVWVPLIVAGTLLSWFGMNDILSVRSSFTEQAVIFRNRHTWLMCWLYTGTFGTFIGMSAGFPLLSRIVFPEVDALRYAYIGPLIGALSRAGSGWIADRYGGPRVTFWVFVLLIVSVAGMLWFLQIQSFPGFLAMVLLLFLISGVGNASTFQMIPSLMRDEVARRAPALAESERRAQAERESAAIIGFASAIAAYGAFYIPAAYGTSIDLTGAANAALWGFLIFYVSCALVTRAVYMRPRSIPAEVSHEPFP